MDLNFFKTVHQPNTPLQRLDGRVKTVFFLFSVVVAAIVQRWYLAAALWMAAIVIFHTLRLPWRFLLQRLAIPFGIAWLVFLSLLINSKGRPLCVIIRSPWALTIYSQGLKLGILMTLRIMAAVTMASALSFCTSMVEILETLRILRLPGIMIDIADMMFRYVFILNEVACNMLNAQTCRTTCKLRWTQRIRNIGCVAVHVLSQSLDRSIKIYNAMLARGYSEKDISPSYFTAPVPAADLRIGLVLTAFPLTILLLNYLM